MSVRAKDNQQTLPLGILLKQELSSERIEVPDIIYGQANQSKKGEDFTFLKTECERVPGDGLSTFSVFGVNLINFLLTCFIWCYFRI